MPDFPELNFPRYDFRIRNEDGKPKILDDFRKKYVALTPEEWVRQHCARLLTENGYPPSVIALEKSIEVNGLKRRFDIVVFDRGNRPFLLVECKQPKVNITAETLNQAAQYNYVLQAPYLWVTNGLKHYIFHFPAPVRKPVLLDKLPLYV